MNNISIWEKTIKQNNPNKINNNLNIDTDILILGGGITGLTTAYFLKDNKKKITLIDKSIIGMGHTSKTTAKITYLQNNIYTTLKKYHNLDVSYKYFNSQKEAINILLRIIKDNNISCDLEKVSSILFTTKEKNKKKIEKERKILTKWKVSTKTVHNKNIISGFSVEDTYIYNPLKYLLALKKIIKEKIDIYENVIASSIIKNNNSYKIITNKGTINTQILVVACHYPFFIFPTLLPFKTYIERSYVNASKVKKTFKYTAINIDSKLHSIRYYKNYLIYGSNNHKLTNKTNYQKNYLQSKKDYIKYFQNYPEYTWMNQDIITYDSLPLIGIIKPNIYISTSYNKWGMTNGTLGAKIITDLINKKDNPYKKIFNPKRINYLILIKSFFGIFNYIKAYIISLFHKNNPYFIKIKGIKYGIYIDSLGIKHKIKLICPHMKCMLVFNKEELTWDCPCHGSRFNIDGILLQGPSTKNIEHSTIIKQSNK